MLQVWPQMLYESRVEGNFSLCGVMIGELADEWVLEDL